MPEDKTVTLFAVARDLTLISDTYANVETAKQQKAFMAEQMTSLNLTPDVEVVTVEVTTTVGTPVLYVEPVDEPEKAETLPEETTDPAAGGDDSGTPQETTAAPTAKSKATKTAATGE